MPAALPYLLEIACAPDCPSRAHVLDFGGRAMAAAVGQTNRRGEQKIKEIVMMAGASEDELAERQSLFDEAQRAGQLTIDTVDAHFDAILALTVDTHPGNRAYAPCVAAQLLTPDAAWIISPAIGGMRSTFTSVLMNRFEAEPSDAVRASILFVLDSIASDGPALPKTGPRATSPSGDTADGIAAALILANREPRSEPAKAVLAAALVDPTFKSRLSPRECGHDRYHNPIGALGGIRPIHFPWFWNTAAAALRDGGFGLTEESRRIRWEGSDNRGAALAHALQWHSSLPGKNAAAAGLAGPN